MSKISIRQRGSLQALVCNGRTVAYEGRISEVSKVGSGKWSGVAGGEPFQIVGGRGSGGASNEWFVRWEPGYGDQWVPAKSALHALRLIEEC